MRAVTAPATTAISSDDERDPLVAADVDDLAGGGLGAGLFQRDKSAPGAQAGFEPITFGVLGHAIALALGPAG